MKTEASAKHLTNAKDCQVAEGSKVEIELAGSLGALIFQERLISGG
jgi:hypothetical protein